MYNLNVLKILSNEGYQVIPDFEGEGEDDQLSTSPISYDEYDEIFFRIANLNYHENIDCVTFYHDKFDDKCLIFIRIKSNFYKINNYGFSQDFDLDNYTTTKNYCVNDVSRINYICLNRYIDIDQILTELKKFQPKR